MKTMFRREQIVGKQVMCISMKDELNPIPSGTMGIVRHYGGGVLNVDWDNGRSLGLVEGVDEFKIIELEEDKIILN